MPKMFEVDNYVLRESARQLDRDKNEATITLTFEPKLGEPVPYQRDKQPMQFTLMIDTPEIWSAIKDAGAEPLIDMIDAEVKRYRAEKEAFIDSEGVPAPYPQFFPEVIEFLVDKDYEVIELE